MMLAMVLARAGLGDSAKNVARRARGGADIDPTQDLAWDEIYVHILRGDKVEALASLKSYLAANPERRATLYDESAATATNWWFRSLENDPQFRALVAARQ
jgi:hypothetical protein